MADDFEKQTLAFLDWLEKVGVQISPKVSLVDLRAEGRGRGLGMLFTFHLEFSVISFYLASSLVRAVIGLNSIIFTEYLVQGHFGRSLLTPNQSL